MPEGTTTLEFKNIELTINYEYSKYFPQTYDYPAEGGDFDIYEVMVGGVNIISLISKEDMDKITERAIENVETDDY